MSGIFLFLSFIYPNTFSFNILNDPKCGIVNRLPNKDFVIPDNFETNFLRLKKFHYSKTPHLSKVLRDYNENTMEAMHSKLRLEVASWLNYDKLKIVLTTPHGIGIWWKIKTLCFWVPNCRNTMKIDTCCTPIIRAKSSVGFHLPRSLVDK